jgi:hypothetical protein
VVVLAAPIASISSAALAAFFFTMSLLSFCAAVASAADAVVRTSGLLFAVTSLPSPFAAAARTFRSLSLSALISGWTPR